MDNLKRTEVQMRRRSSAAGTRPRSQYAQGGSAERRRTQSAAGTARSGQRRDVQGVRAQRSGQRRSEAQAYPRGQAQAAARQAAPNRRSGSAVDPRRQQMRRKAYLKKKRQQVFLLRFLFLFFVITVGYLGYRGVSGVANYIESSREMQRGELETVSFVDPISELQNESVLDISDYGPASDMTAAQGADAEESGIAAETTGTDPTDSNLVLSGGRYIDITKPMIAFTFDDGPKTDVEQTLMEALEAVDGRATFFFVGERIQNNNYQTHVKEIYDRGHEIANHSWSHNTKMSKQSADYIRSEFEKTDSLVESITGESPKVYRLPGGNISDTIRSTVQKPMIYWSIDTLDWKSRDSASVQSTVLGKVKDGDIVLMHSLYNSTAQACVAMIPQLHEQGFQFVTVSELITLRQADVHGGNGKQYSNFPPAA